MAKKSEFFEPSETGNWNVASDFTKLKIMKHLYEADQYEIVATFGTHELVEEFMTDDNMKSLARLKAIKRLIKTLQMIVHNTIFAVKKRDKETMKTFLKDLNKVEEVLPKLQNESFNQKTNRTTVDIEEKSFNKVLNILIKIKSDINEPLNNADLIFTAKDELDIDNLKKQNINKIIEQG